MTTRRPVARRWPRGLLALLFAGTCATAQSPEDIRIALVIGNAAYPGSAALANPVNDAAAMGAALRRLGFGVLTVQDGSRAQMLEAVSRLRERLQGKRGVGLFYYAGHGLQLEWRNYMVPVDARLGAAGDVPAQTLDVEAVIGAFREAGNRTNIVVLDACRDNPFAGTSSGKGLAQMDAPPGTLLAYATAPGNVAEDGVGAANGLYTGYLVQELARPAARIEDVFKRVRLQVRQQSKGRQIPWESTSLEEDFYFDDGQRSALRPEDLERLAAEARQNEQRLLQQAAQARERERQAALALEQERQRQAQEAQARERERQRLLAEQQERERLAAAERARLAEETRRAEIARAQAEAEAQARERERQRLLAEQRERERAAAAERERLAALALEQERRRQAEELLARERERTVAAERARQLEEARRAELARAQAEAEAQLRERERQRLVAEQRERERLAAAERDRLAALALEQERRRQAEEAQARERERVAAEERARQAEEARRAALARAQAEAEAQARERERALLAAQQQERERAAAAAQALELARLADQERLKQATAQQTQASVAARPREREAPDSAAAERAFAQEKADWDRIANSNDANDFFAFLQKYPSGRISELASAALDRLAVAQIEQVANRDGIVQVPAVQRYQVGDVVEYTVRDELTKVITQRGRSRVTSISDNQVSLGSGTLLTREGGTIRNTFIANMDPPRLDLPAGDYAVGKHWTFRSIQTNHNGSRGWVEGTVKIVALEEVTVPAGTFKAYRLELSSIAQWGERVRLTRWMLPDWGFPVKQFREIRPRTGAPTLETWEMTSRERTKS